MANNDPYRALIDAQNNTVAHTTLGQLSGAAQPWLGVGVAPTPGIYQSPFPNSTTYSDYHQQQIHQLHQQLGQMQQLLVKAEADAKTLMELQRFLRIMSPETMTDFENYVQTKAIMQKSADTAGAAK